ncbi:MAG: helix-turn-helix domain-containing protein [Mycobacterium sp.]
MKVNPPVRRTQAERTAATRAALLTAARNLFADKGFSEVSTQEIVAAAGVTRGALYHQFADKAELFTAVYEEVEAELVAAVAAGVAREDPAGAVAAMRHGARLFLELCAAPEAQRIVLVDAPSVLGWEQWRAMGVKYGLGVIEAMLAHAVAEGEIPEQPLRASAHVLLGALDEAALYVSRAEDPQRAREEMYAVCDRLITGLTALD